MLIELSIRIRSTFDGFPIYHRYVFDRRSLDFGRILVGCSLYLRCIGYINMSLNGMRYLKIWSKWRRGCQNVFDRRSVDIRSSFDRIPTGLRWRWFNRCSINVWSMFDRCYRFLRWSEVVKAWKSSEDMVWGGPWGCRESIKKVSIADSDSQRSISPLRVWHTGDELWGCRINIH